MTQFSCAGLLMAACAAAFAQTADPLTELLNAHQLDLAENGKAFLINEGSRASFVLVGGLHGDQETQTLVQTLAAGLEQSGYRHLAVEMSPWAAARLEASLKLEPDAGVRLRGADIEEIQPHLLIRDLAALNPQNRTLSEMVEITKAGYRRPSAPQLLQLARQVGDVKDVTAGGVSLHALMLKTLEVESIRAAGNQRFDASVRREAIMKELFGGHYRAAARDQANPKFIVAFGQSHLGRGIDQRGVSTLGNFIAELAAAESTQSFHILLFAAGGKIAFRGLQDIDQRKDNAAFAFLASLARHPASVFDLRPVRRALHAGSAPLSSRDESLRYWADLYDAVVCYREVTPLGGIPKR